MHSQAVFAGSCLLVCKINFSKAKTRSSSHLTFSFGNLSKNPVSPCVKLLRLQTSKLKTCTARIQFQYNSFWVCLSFCSCLNPSCHFLWFISTVGWKTQNRQFENRRHETKHKRLQLNIKNVFTLLSLNWRQKLNSRSGGTLPVTEDPAASYWPPHSRCIHFYLKNRKSTSETGMAVCVCACGCVRSLFFYSSLYSQPPNLSLQGQLSHPLPEPDSHSATPTPRLPLTHTHISISLRTSECNLLSLYLTLGHPSITETLGKTTDAVRKHHCPSPPKKTFSDICFIYLFPQKRDSGR